MKTIIRIIQSIRCWLFHRKWRRQYWMEFSRTFHRCDYCERLYSKPRKAPRPFRRTQ